jgi:two-component system, OmpR family, phosphate regulon response regulator OmpR
MQKDKPHVLVVDDDKRIASLVCRYLGDQGFIALSADDAAQARNILNNMSFDALIVDVMMPGESGLDFTRALQNEHKSGAPPILLLTALGEVDDRLHGFEAGADDYLSKPFEPKELLLRLNAILKRTRKALGVERYKIGSWLFDETLQTLDNGSEAIRLTTMEINLLRALIRKPGEVISREELALACELDAGERTIDVQVTRLRRKIEEDSKNPKYLQTVRGKGYLLRAEVAGDGG